MIAKSFPITRLFPRLQELSWHSSGQLPLGHASFFLQASLSHLWLSGSGVISSEIAHIMAGVRRHCPKLVTLSVHLVRFAQEPQDNVDDGNGDYELANLLEVSLHLQAVTLRLCNFLSAPQHILEAMGGLKLLTSLDLAIPRRFSWTDQLHTLSPQGASLFPNLQSFMLSISETEPLPMVGLMIKSIQSTSFTNFCLNTSGTERVSDVRHI